MVASYGMNQCCCGCTLKTGSIIIGTLSMISGALSLLILLHYVYEPQYAIDHFNINVSYVVGALFGFLQLVMGITLIIGVDRNRHQLVRPWLYLSYFRLGMDLVGCVYSIYLLAIASATGTTIALAVTSMSIYICIMVYCITVVFSYYKLLLEHGTILPTKQAI